MMKSAIHLAIADDAQREQVARLYRLCGYEGGIAPRDEVHVAIEGAMLIAAVRLCPEQGVTVLRGMQVRPGYRRRGIGAALLAGCVSRLEHGVSYCLPYTHLVPFYAPADFQVIEQDQAPDFLAQRLRQYRCKGEDLLVMRRIPRGSFSDGLHAWAHSRHELAAVGASGENGKASAVQP